MGQYGQAGGQVWNFSVLEKEKELIKQLEAARDSQSQVIIGYQQVRVYGVWNSGTPYRVTKVTPVEKGAKPHPESGR